MLETLMTSKIRVILIKHFLEHCGERFYLRQLERLLQLPLTPARRELIRLEKMGLLKQEQEANLKFFRLNEGFEHVEELKKLVGIEKTVEPTYHLPPTTYQQNWLAPVFGLVALLMILQVGLFYIWTNPVVGMGDSHSAGGGLTQRTATATHSKENGEWKMENGKIEKREAVTLATDSYVMSSGKARLESGGFGGWQ